MIKTEKSELTTQELIGYVWDDSWERYIGLRPMSAIEVRFDRRTLKVSFNCASHNHKTIAEADVYIDVMREAKKIAKSFLK